VLQISHEESSSSSDLVGRFPTPLGRPHDPSLGRSESLRIGDYNRLSSEKCSRALDGGAATEDAPSEGIRQRQKVTRTQLENAAGGCEIGPGHHLRVSSSTADALSDRRLDNFYVGGS